MKNLFRDGRGRRWNPDAEPSGAPEGSLLRADNLVPDPDGILSLRAGSETVYADLQTRVHSLYSCYLDGKKFRFAGSDGRLFKDGEDFGQEFDGLGDIYMGDDSFQAFFARGKTKKKFDGQQFHNWSIPAPQYPVELDAVDAITLEAASFNAAESPAFVINEGTGEFVTGQDGTASGALKLTPAESGRASASKKFVADQDYLNILGTTGGDTDLFDIYIWFEEPNEVDKLTIMFGLGTDTDPYKDDYYYFDFQIGDVGTVDVKDGGATAAAAYSIYADRIRTALTPAEITDVKNLEQITTILKRLGRFAGPRSRERKDSQEASPAWTHLSVTRGQFNRVGSTAGRDWQTVRGFKIVYTGKPGSTKTSQYDDAVWTGGGNRSLTGRFRIGYRYVRDFEDKYFEMSPISPISEPIDVTQQSIEVTIPAVALTDKDPQVNQIWVYVMGGFLDTYYRFAVVSAVIRQGMTIDELTNPAGTDFQTKSERTRLTAWGFSKITGGDNVAADLVFTLHKSELEALIENEVLEPGASGVPDDVVAVAGPYNSRMFVLTKEGRLFPSNQNNPSSFSLYHHLDLRRYGDPLWAVRTGGGVYIGMTKDIIRVAGSGDESPDHITADFYPEPLNVGNPPVDQATVTDGNAIVYRSADGLMMLTGQSLVPVPFAGTSLLWQGRARHGVEPLNTAWGRFRMAIDNHILFMAAPEGERHNRPLLEVEEVEWAELIGFEESEGVLTKTTAGTRTKAIATKELLSVEGYVEAVVSRGVAFIALSNQSSNGEFDKAAFSLRTTDTGRVDVYESGLLITNARAAYRSGDTLRVEMKNRKIYYSTNGEVFYTSETAPTFPLYADVGVEDEGDTIGPVSIFGNWTEVNGGTEAIWRYSLQKQQWSRTTYRHQFLSLFRDPDGMLLAGTDTDGQVIELEVGTQDDGSAIAIEVRTPIDDGGDPLARKDALDFQIHADTGGARARALFALDGVSAPDPEMLIPFTTTKPEVYRADALHLGVFLKAQLVIIGRFDRFVLHAYNLTYRNRVQQTMVLDTGTIQPNGPHQIVWLSEAEIDCISPVDLEVDLYLDDVLWTTQPVVVLPNRRSSYRVPLPRGSKARAPRLVFRTTNDDAAGNPGFEAYRVRVRDRGTGKDSEAGFRPIWPLGEAP